MYFSFDQQEAGYCKETSRRLVTPVLQGRISLWIREETGHSQLENVGAERKQKEILYGQGWVIKKEEYLERKMGMI